MSDIQNISAKGENGTLGADDLLKAANGVITAMVS